MIALLLTGGGARAAYQVGVLAAIAHALRRRSEPGATELAYPFKILCGTSAGALNVATLASHPDGFLHAVLHLERIWSGFRAELVFVADSFGLASSAGKWLGSLTLGWLSGHTPKALLDTSPLRRLLSRELDLSQIDRHLQAQRLQAVAVSASSYSSGEHLTFYCANKLFQPWERAKRRAIRSLLTVEHLLASSAIPVLFPPVAIEVEGRLQWFGAAIHLGARAVLAIGTNSSPQEDHFGQIGQNTLPSLAQIGGHALAGLFLDSLAFDAEQLARTNQVIRQLDPQARAQSSLREIDLLQINPSQAIEPIALRYRLHLPWMLRKLFGRVGATEAPGAVMLSYLLFEQGFTNALMDLGKQDAHAMMHSILAFIDHHS
ncbi:MAG: patatin-like phospholipase family protein [Betaproteobacteria bacterium]|nr:patatin-like phospholipase family protein [Betaproteobacteria bacterium]